LKRNRHRQQHGVEAAKKLNVIQPVSSLVTPIIG